MTPNLRPAWHWGTAPPPCSRFVVQRRPNEEAQDDLICRKLPTYHRPVTADVFSAVSNHSRRVILDELCNGPRTAGELTGLLDLSRSAASEHLAVLREAGLVREERRGRHRMYHLEPAGLAEVGGWVKHFEHYWTQRLDALADLLDEEKML